MTKMRISKANVIDKLARFPYAFQANQRDPMPDDFYAHVGALMKQRRDAMGMTQRTLAVKAGVSRTSIANIERGGQSILVHQLLNIAKALKVQPMSLLPKEAPKAQPQYEVEFPETIRTLLDRLQKEPTRSRTR